jgi:cytochrome c oxidase cbb3-type subunit 2
MCGSVRHTLALVVGLCLGSFTADPAVGQPPQSGFHAAQSGFDAEKGRALYTTYCSSCHGANGEGQPGTYPPLKGSGVVTKADATKHTHVVLDGLQGGRAGGVQYALPMPPFGSILDDANIANIIDYERSSWGNHGKLVTAAQVTAERGRSK